MTADKVHWYYALAVDKTGNWDRVPNPDAGNYAYLQTGFDVCDFTPQAPEQVSAKDAGAVPSSRGVPRRSTPDGGLPLRADDALTYDVEYNNGGAGGSAPDGANLSSRSYTHSSPGRRHHPTGSGRRTPA